MVSLRTPPTFIPTTPWSQPLMTWPRSQLERERLSVILRRIKLRAVGQPARVMNRHALARQGFVARADLGVFHFQFGHNNSWLGCRSGGWLRRCSSRWLLVLFRRLALRAACREGDKRENECMRGDKSIQCHGCILHGLRQSVVTGRTDCKSAHRVLDQPVLAFGKRPFRGRIRVDANQPTTPTHRKGPNYGTCGIG